MKDVEILSSAPAVNTAAVVNVGRRTGKRVSIMQVSVSYNAAPTGGNLQVVGSSSGKGYNVDIPVADVRTFAWDDPGLLFIQGDDVTLTLAAAGAAVSGKLNVMAQWRDIDE